MDRMDGRMRAVRRTVSWREPERTAPSTLPARRPESGVRVVAGRCTPKHDKEARGAHSVFLYLFWIEMEECTESRNRQDSTLSERIC